MIASMLAPPGRKDAALAQQPADGDIFAAVLVGIANPHDLAVGQLQPARALDLQEEQFDRIGRPADFQPAAGERPILDLGPRVIEDAIALMVDPAAALARPAP